MARLVALLVLSAATLVVTASPPAAGEVDECRGEPATLVGEPHGLLTGTNGPDVVVSNGARLVNAGAGDDLICVTGADKRPVIEGQAGDDTIVVLTTRSRRVAAVLGPGDDHFVGGPGHETVKTGDPADEPGGIDHVATGAGNDLVFLTTPSSSNGGEADQIDLGAGDDAVAMERPGLASAAQVDGGPGQDRLGVSAGGGADVTVDARSHTITRDGLYLSDWTSIERYGVAANAVVVTFEGSSRAEEYLVGDGSHIVAHMRGGDDSVLIGDTHPARLTGGPGRDDIYLFHSGPSDGGWVDLTKGVIGTVGAQQTQRGEIAGFEDAGVEWRTSRSLLVGTDGPNRLRAGCGGLALGRGGNDRLTAHKYSGPCAVLHAEGGAGNDVLIGTEKDDRLIGGPGRDEARGRGGRDKCVAEVKVSCERR